MMCVFQGERGRDGVPGFPGLQGPPVSKLAMPHMSTTTMNKICDKVAAKMTLINI